MAMNPTPAPEGTAEWHPDFPAEVQAQHDELFKRYSAEFRSAQRVREALGLNPLEFIEIPLWQLHKLVGEKGGTFDLTIKIGDHIFKMEPDEPRS